jgi:hypothetical protein
VNREDMENAPAIDQSGSDDRDFGSAFGHSLKEYTAEQRFFLNHHEESPGMETEADLISPLEPGVHDLHLPDRVV